MYIWTHCPLRRYQHLGRPSLNACISRSDYIPLWSGSKSIGPVRDSPKRLPGMTSDLTLLLANECRIKFDLSCATVNAYTSGCSLVKPTIHLALVHSHGYCDFSQPTLPPELALTYAERCCYLIQAGPFPVLVLVLTSDRYSHCGPIQHDQLPIMALANGAAA